jgi:phosphatidylserine decarboxylase
MRIHREGYAILTGTILALGLINILALIFAPGRVIIIVPVMIVSIIVFLLVLQFFRYPKRNLSRNDNCIICPADGKVVAIEKTFEAEYFKEERLQISIFMSPFNVHANWYPVSGKIKFLRYHKGKKLVAWHPKSSTENERTTIVIQKENKIEILVRQIAGALANRIVYYPHEGDMIRQGAELGFIKFGSRVDLFLPVNANVNVHLDQKVQGGTSVIAELV